jgi:phosphoglycerol transferase MdoB-like AlkP superfamily enzyme
MKRINTFLNRLYRHRFGPVVLLAILVIGVSFITRVGLMVWSFGEMDILSLLFSFATGLFFDIIAASFFVLPLALYCWLMKDIFYRKPWQKPLLYIFFIVGIIIIVFNAIAEFAFWDEFKSRYNFIAVDYLIYTNEVMNNIIESYNMPLVIIGLLIAGFILFLPVRKKADISLHSSLRFKQRTKIFILYSLLPLAGYFLVKNTFKNISGNRYNNELGGNGMYEFGAAFWNNEIDYNHFYATRNDTANIAILRKMLQAPNAVFSNDLLSVERKINSRGLEKKWNIVLISVESLSGDYMRYFGNNNTVTPYLDSLIPHSLFFSNFYASGTRTVRGLEALALAIPPTPGQSIVRRPDNEDMFSMGSVLKGKGYDVKYIYGGNSFFDNMGYFFGHNGYTVLDKRDIPERLVHHTTAWGIDDEGSFDFTLEQCDKSHKEGNPFFNHIMTVSNHRPYTYPEGRIDIPPSAQVAEGAVKYTDYSIHKFLEDARQKPWFNNTLFVIVADHCSRSAGKTDLPVNNYHIPCFIYSPQLIRPVIEKRLTSQIDLAPTILGLLNLSYTSRFLGYDVYKTPAAAERIFISTYQNLGYIREGRMIVLSPQKKTEQLLPNFITGAATKMSVSDTLLNEAIAWYQGAAYLFKSGRYKK